MSGRCRWPWIPLSLAMALAILAPHRAVSGEPSLDDRLDDLVKGGAKAKAEAAALLAKRPQAPERAIPLPIKALDDVRPEQPIPNAIFALRIQVADHAQRALVSYGTDAVPWVTNDDEVR